MNLREVQNCVNDLIERGYEDSAVIITIDDSSIGARAYSEISSIL